jgi:hypothetical protein
MIRSALLIASLVTSVCKPPPASLLRTAAKETGRTVLPLPAPMDPARAISFGLAFSFLSGLALFHNPCGLTYEELVLLVFFVVELLAFLFQGGLDFTLTSLGFPLIEGSRSCSSSSGVEALASELGSPQGSPGMFCMGLSLSRLHVAAHIRLALVFLPASRETPAPFREWPQAIPLRRALPHS